MSDLDDGLLQLPNSGEFPAGLEAMRVAESAMPAIPTESGNERGSPRRRSAYLRAALKDEAASVAACTTNRNDRLNLAAFRLGQLSHLDEAVGREIARALLNACDTNGLISEDGQSACAATIRSGLQAGAAAPRATY